MADTTTNTSSGGILDSIDRFLSQGISAYVDTQLAQYAYANNPQPNTNTPTGASPAGQPVQAAPSLGNNGLAVGLGIAAVALLVILVVKR